MLKASVILFIAILISFLSKAQDQLLTSFNGQQIEDHIHLAFTVKGGVQCFGTEVQRGIDSIHFETIGVIPGICGNANFDVSYTFEDTLPVPNEFNYYRISFGQLGNSYTIKLKFTYYQDDFVIVPNPGNGSLTILFSNFNHQPHTFSLINLNGTILKEAGTTGNEVFIDKSSLPSGIYLIRISRENELLSTQKIALF